MKVAILISFFISFLALIIASFVPDNYLENMFITRYGLALTGSIIIFTINIILIVKNADELAIGVCNLIGYLCSLGALSVGSILYLRIFHKKDILDHGLLTTAVDFVFMCFCFVIYFMKYEAMTNSKNQKPS